MSDLSNIFKAYDIRGKVGAELNEPFVNTIGKVFGDWLPEDGIVAVGHDMRPDSASLAKAFIEGLIAQGRTVWDLGLITSDMGYWAIGQWDLAGSAVITASHNPGQDNGIKLYRDKVTPIGLSSGLAEIRDKALAGAPEPAATPGSVESKDISAEWIDHCMKFIGDLKPFNIAIDAGNGMAGAILPKIIPRLPIAVAEMYFELDGTFPNHEANPQKPENVQDLADRVLKDGLDFGIAFDGDGDRAGFVDDLGRPVLGTDLMTIVAGYYLEKQGGSGKVIHDVRTSRATQELIREWGGTPIRVKAGRVVIGAEVRAQGAIFGGETTGHFFYTENYDADSGLIVALTAMQAISDSGKKLSELVDEYRRYAIVPETNFKVSADKETIFENIKAEFPDGEFDMLDGLTVNYPDFWFNLRASNTEPVMRLNLEANTDEKLQSVLTSLKALIA